MLLGYHESVALLMVIDYICRKLTFEATEGDMLIVDLVKEGVLDASLAEFGHDGAEEGLFVNGAILDGDDERRGVHLVEGPLYVTHGHQNLVV